MIATTTLDALNVLLNASENLTRHFLLLFGAFRTHRVLSVVVDKRLALV